MHTRVTSLKVWNLGIIEDAEIALDKPVVLFLGDVKQGKSTMLRAVQFLAGGSIPSDILRHGEMEGGAKLTLDSGSITRTVYRAKDKSIKTRPISYVVDGEAQAGDVAKRVAALFNPFLLDQSHFTGMSNARKSEFLLEILNVDTSTIDARIAKGEEQAKKLRAEIKAAGNIEPVEVKLVDVEALTAERDAIVGKAVDEIFKVQQANDAANARAAERNTAIAKRDAIDRELGELRKKVELMEADLLNWQKWLTEHPDLPQQPLPDMPDTSALDNQLAEAKAIEVRHEMYLKDKAALDALVAKKDQLKKTDDGLKMLRTKRRAALVEASRSCAVADLEVGDSGECLYQGTTMDMLSDSQGIELSGRLQALYPDGLGMELIDRAESLGLFSGSNTSLADLIDRAKMQERNILAAVVADRPAEVPDEVGVFIVANGNIKDMDAPDAPAAAEEEEPDFLM